MTQPEHEAAAPTPLVREAVAAIIDPWAMNRAECDPETEEACADALTKADAILALVSTAQAQRIAELESGQPDPTEGLPGKLAAIYAECANGRPINGGDLEVIEDAAHALLAATRAEQEARAGLEKARGDEAGRGMVIAAGIIVSAFDCPVEAEEILRAAGITTVREARAIGVDDYDIGLLRDVFKQMNRKARASLNTGARSE